MKDLQITSSANQEQLIELFDKLAEYKWRILCLLWGALLYWRLMPVVLCSLQNSKLFGYWNKVFSLFANDFILNCFLLFCIVIFCLAFLYKRFTDCYSSIWLIIISAFVIWAIGYDNLWQYLPIYEGIDYSWVLYVFFIGIIIVEIFKYRWQQVPSKDNPDNVDYMTDNDPRDRGLVPPRYLMVCDIATRLLKTKTDKESFAVGITGSWGTGKSTFLEHLRDELKDYAFVIDFRPWDSQDSKQIINDFFCSVRDAVSPYYTPVSQPLVRYAQMLNGLDVHPLQRWLSERVVSHYQDDVQNSKKILSDCMANLRKPVVVFIDDLDRLEADEAFEMLRLIRNTANLKNTYFIAAYDKNYLVSMLKSKGLPKASQYLEKIFNLEVPMPVAESIDVANMFLADLNWMLSSLKIKYALEIEECLDLSAKRHLSYILGSFRQARRIARLMASQISTTRHIAELDYVDLLWLDLLQSTDYEVYVTLCHKPT